MSTLTSEQAITALEHSSKPTVELLDDAAAIFGFSTWDNTCKTDSGSSLSIGSDNVKFREQWILRWIIKKLNQSVDIKHTPAERSSELLSDLRTWALLRYLLSSIPKYLSKDILLERNFCHILSKCLATVSKPEHSKLPDDKDVSMSDQSDQDEGRPSKKRKLSRDRSIPKYPTTQTKSLLLTSLLHVTNQTADCLSVVDNKDLVHRTCVTSDWAVNVDEAARFVARLTTAVSFVLSNLPGRIQHEGSLVAGLADTLHQWIELWQTNAKAALNQPKQDSCVAFTNHALIPVLDFLAGGLAQSMKTVSQAFERQIALYCVLPIRSMFQKRFAGVWNSWETEPQIETVQPVIAAIYASLRDAAAGFDAPKSANRASTLIRIASRLVPRSDMINRKVERSWIEALFLSLSCRPHALPTALPVEVEPFTPTLMSDTHLNALQSTGIEPSIHFWRFYVRHALSGNVQDVPVTTLAKIVRLNASAFLPETRKSDASPLDALCVVLAENLRVDDYSLETALNDVMAPIVEDFGRTRQLEFFINFWASKLMDAFHDRISKIPEHPYRVLWDHPAMVEVFSSICQRHAPPSLCINLLETVTEDLVNLSEVVGPTHECFARITILSSMLGPLGKLPTVQVMFNAQSKPVVSLIQKALLRSTDYQGHRWRLWKLLELCTVLFPSAPRAENLPSSGLTLQSSPFTAFKDFKPQTKRPKSEYLEGYQWFSFVISSYENLEDSSAPKLVDVVMALNDLIELCVRHSVSTKISSDSWNGAVDTMDSLPKMISACLARLARSSVALSSAENVPQDFLTNLASLTFSCNESGNSSCLAVAAEAMLARMTIPIKMSLTDIYVDLLLTSFTASTIPPLLVSAAREMTSERQTLDLIKALCKVMEETNLDSHEKFTDCLSLVNESLLKYPSSAVKALDVAVYIKFLGRSTSGAKLPQLTAAYQFIQQTTGLIFAQTGTKWRSGENEPGLERLLQLTQEHLTGIDASKKSKLLAAYTGYLSLVVARIAHESGATKTPKSVRKTVDQIKENHGPAALKQCNLYLEKPSGVIDFWRIFVLLDSLVRPQDDKSFNKKLQRCLQGVAQAILTINTKKSENITLTQEAGVVAKLRHILSKYMKTTRSKHIPPFPHPGFLEKLGQGESVNALETQAQLAASYPTQASLSSLALLAKLSNIEEQPPSSNDGSDRESKPFLSIAARIGNLVLDHASTDANTIEVFGHIAFLQTAVNETSPASLIARLELSKLVLEKHPLVVNQHVIDSTLKSITLLASSASKAVIPTEVAHVKPEHIFDRLCTILSTLLVRYRRRLAGRYHLFLPVIQNLLKCLFYPSSRKHLTTSPSPSKFTYLASLPEWLNPPTHTSTLTLPPTSAAKFSRVLQQLSDPSASSARHVSKRVSTPNDNLVDEVKSLRREVSQHTQYLLQTYCQVMLDGSIAPEVKEKLLPGLYVVMNATDVEVMRALNTAMDVSQRAIWKDLYSEWKTYGRWNQQ